MQGGKLDIMETIFRLLFRNQRNQDEFRQMDGYGILQGLLDQLVATSPADTALFLHDCFNIFFAIALDGNADLVRSRVDAADRGMRCSPSALRYRTSWRPAANRQL